MRQMHTVLVVYMKEKRPCFSPAFLFVHVMHMIKAGSKYVAPLLRSAPLFVICGGEP